MTSPAGVVTATRGQPWQSLVQYTVELGTDARWAAALSRWDHQTWSGTGGGRWIWGLSADWQTVPLDRVTSIKIGGGADDLTTELPTLGATVDIWNPDGTYGPTGGGWWLGALLRIWCKVGGGARRVIFWGTIDEPHLGGTVDVPMVTLTAHDALAQWATSRPASAPGNAPQTITQRLTAMADALAWPPSGRDFAADTTALAPDPNTGALDVASRAAASGLGLLWADPADPYAVIRYRPATWVDNLLTVPPVLALMVGVAPPPPPGTPVARATAFEAAFNLAGVENVIEASTLDGLSSNGTDTASVARFGYRAPSPVTDLSLSTQAGLDWWVAERLRRSAWPRPHVSPLTVTVYDAATALAAGVRVGDVLWISADHHGDPVGFRAVCTGVEHDVSAGDVAIGLHAVALRGVNPNRPIVPLSGTGTLTVLVTKGHLHARLALAGAGDLTVHAIAHAVHIAAKAALDGSGTFTVTMRPRSTGKAPLDGSGTLTVHATAHALHVGAQLDGAGVLTVAVRPRSSAKVPLDGSGTLTVAVRARTIHIAAKAALDGSGTLTVAVRARDHARVALDGTGTLTAKAGAHGIKARAALDGTGTLTAAASSRAPIPSTVVATVLDSGGSSASATSYATNAFTPTAGAVILVAVLVHDLSGAKGPVTITGTGGAAGPWNGINDVGGAATVPAMFLSWARATGGGAGTLTFGPLGSSTGGNVADGIAYVVLQLTGAAVAPIVQSAVLGTVNDTLTLTLAAFSDPNNAAVSFFGAYDNAGGAMTVTPGSGLTQLQHVFQAVGGGDSLALLAQWRQTAQTAHAATVSAANDSLIAIATEIAHGFTRLLADQGDPR